MQNKILKKFKKTQKKTKRIANTHNVLNESYSHLDEKIYVKKAYDSYIVDYDNNTYIDTAMGGGSFLLGHSQKFIQEAVKKQLSKGSLYTLPHVKVHKLGKLLHKVIPHFEKFVFCSTGSEATMRAIRIARTYTNRKKIAIFSGGWHGSHDLLLVDDSYTTKESSPQKILKSNGTLENILDDIILLPYNHKEAFKLIKEHKDELAMVFIEPAQGSNPRDDMSSFLHKLRKITEEYNILLGFDEIITGFRVALGGGQEYYNIKADIATYGKSVGGGFPLAVVGGTNKVMQSIKNGNKKNPQAIFMGGTFSANPLSVASSYETLKYLVKNEKKVYGSLEKSGKYVKNAINKICKDEKVSAHMIGINSMLRFVFTDYPIKSRHNRDTYEVSLDVQNLFYTDLLNEGVHIASNRINFLSMKHRKKELKQIISAYEVTIKKFKKEGYL
ncbi:aminotransferase class III-fold pyridoxal phosphate-dependent enzyme [Sulfurimonas sp. SAG-AH-194-I05]|nr:aminotransferase class III-fold pyridoxal phosphate-dependent enzyme [Sulfurimonas sp. SAG-AH-194-I05]MDF1875770.1 aminotransferase class III-fold pyridoxal phosphate-dependent enzyme [Sulfurimonas sp. SAG-AH-194-I05]